MAKEQVNADSPVDFDAIHKLPRDWRYVNISVFWILYYESLVRLLHKLRIRHELVTSLSIISGMLGAWMIVRAQTTVDFILAAFLVHSKDVFDACDGALARLTATGHRFGRFLDTIGDGIVFTAWIAACALRAVDAGMTVFSASLWGLAAWLSLFLQCSYFNYHQLHYIRLSGAELTSRLDERQERAAGAVSLLAALYDLWFGWQDRLIARIDRRLRHTVGLPAESEDRANRDWFGHRAFMTANSALCFGTHAFLLLIFVLSCSPFLFLPAVAIGMNIYWAGIVLARLVVFRRGT